MDMTPNDAAFVLSIPCDLTTDETPVVAPTTPTWRIGFHPFAALAAIVHPVVSAIHAFTRSPVLPHAQIWEASLLASFLKEPEYFEPDPFATESPFLSDSWPRG